MCDIEVQLVPHRAALLADQDNMLDVLVRARADEAPERSQVRPPLNLAFVIDGSSSMRGSPLCEAIRCTSMMFDRLAPTDRASLVVYGREARVLVSVQPASDRAAFHAALGEVTSGGQTALHAGWLRGALQAAGGAAPPALSRVMLLSDGQANVGLRCAAEISPQCAELAGAGVSTSTYGLGRNFNEELMTSMAGAGRGNAYYGRGAEDLMDGFQQEFDLMSATCARSVRLAITPSPSVGVEVLNSYRTDSTGAWVLPDIAYGSEAWALLRLTIPRGVVEKAGGGVVHLLSATVNYHDLDGGQHAAGPAHLRLNSLPANAFNEMARDELVARRAGELRAARQMEEARRAARRGDWADVEVLLDLLRAEAASSPWLAAAITELETYARNRETERFSKETAYKAGKMNSRLAALDEAQQWSESREASRASFLRRKREQGRGLPTEGGDRGA